MIPRFLVLFCLAMAMACSPAPVQRTQFVSTTSQSTATLFTTDTPTLVSISTLIPSPSATFTAIPTLTLSLTLKPSPTFTPSPTTPAPKEAVAVVQAYYEARIQSNYTRAASFISNYIINHSSMTREVFKQMEEDREYRYGFKLTEFKIIESRMLDSQTPLVHVAYKTTIDDSFQSTWEALREEDGRWRINVGGVVDFLDVTPQTQTVNGVTVWLRTVWREAEKIRVFIGVKNDNARWVVWGSYGLPDAVFHFEDKTLAATNVSGKRFEPFYNYGDLGASIELSGTFSIYPDSIDLNGWQMGQESAPIREPGSDSWEYHFQIK